MGHLYILPFEFNADLRVLALQRYSTFPRSPDLKLHHLVLLSVFYGMRYYEGVFPLYKEYSKCILAPSTGGEYYCIFT